MRVEFVYDYNAIPIHPTFSVPCSHWAFHTSIVLTY